VRQNARTARLVTQLQTRTPPSTFCWSIHRWKNSSPLSVLSAMRLRASSSIRDLADRFGSFEVWVSGLGGTSTRGRRSHFEVDVTTRTRDETRGRQRAAQTATRDSIPFFSFYPIYLPLYLGLFRFGSLSYLYVTHQTCAAMFKRSSARHPITSR
jgi:hypothetical protein